MDCPLCGGETLEDLVPGRKARHLVCEIGLNSDGVVVVFLAAASGCEGCHESAYQGDIEKRRAGSAG